MISKFTQFLFLIRSANMGLFKSLFAVSSFSGVLVVHVTPVIQQDVSPGVP